VSADPAHCALQQRIAGGVSVHIVDSLQADDVDVGDRQPAVQSARTIDLMMKVLQASRAHPGSGERVSLGDCQLAEQRVVVALGLKSIVSSLLAIVDRLLAIDCRPGSCLGRPCAVGGGRIAVIRRAPD
jgi:hypothetical protein